MFDIGWGELLVIGIVALIAIGPKELPGALRALGQWTGKIRRMAGEFQSQFQEAMREAELADLKKEVDDMAAKAQSYANFDPIEDVRRDIENAVGELPPLEPSRESAAVTTTASSDAAAAASEPVATSLPSPAGETAPEAATTAVPTPPDETSVSAPAKTDAGRPAA
jgi:sec-independent protein translocase protein TatB